MDILNQMSVASAELRKLNNYPEFKTNAGINSIMVFIQSNNNARIFPNNIHTNRKKQRYNEKYNGNSGFVVQNATLFYRKPNLGIDLEVVYPNEKQQKISSIYNDVTKGLGTGLSQFYQQVSMKYLNIKKEDTDTFLRKQGDYVVTRLPRKQINAPIIAKIPNERWGIDLIDMSSYTENNENSPKWILSVVDYYSSKVFARHMPNKSLVTIKSKMEDICQTNNTYPRILQADGEFHAGNPNQANVLERWCDEHNIEFVKTLSYTPTSNGKIERMNREIRKKIRAGFVRNNNNAWADQLQDYIDNINSQQIARTRHTPNALWAPGYDNANVNRRNPFLNVNNNGRVEVNIPRRNDNMTAVDMRNIQQAKQIKRAQDMLKTSEDKYGKPREFNVGDKVRISLYTISNKMRELRKERRINKIAVNYSPEVYIVTSRNENRQGVRNTSYTLKNAETGLPVMNQPRRQGGLQTARRFFANELISTDKVGNNNIYRGYVDTNIRPINVARALQLNKVNN
jgi:hypothetical protein